MTTNETEQPTASATLGDALRDYLESLKPGLRVSDETYVKQYVSFVGYEQAIDFLSGARVESYVEGRIRSTDPNAEARVAALKRWFQYLKKKGHTTENYGIHVRVRRSPGASRSVGSRTRVEEAPVEMTQEGIDQLQKELEELQGNTPELVQAISVAREDKDFRENAPLDAAREALGYNEGRIKSLTEALKRAVVVQGRNDERSSIGSTVQVTRLTDDRTLTYKLVGANEANARESRISVDSPVGRELLGRLPGDEVVVVAPSGEIRLRVDSVTHSR